MFSRGIYYSALLHILLIALFVFGLPHFSKELPKQERVITLDILPVRQHTNVKPSPPKPIAQKPAPKKEPPKKVAKAKPAPPPKPTPPKAEPVIQAKKPAPKVAPTPKVEPAPKKVAKPKEKEKVIAKPTPPAPPKPKPPVKTVAKKPTPPKPKTDDFASVLASVEEISSTIKEPPAEPEEVTQAQDDKTPERVSRFNDDLPLSISEIDAIRRQIEPHWTVLGGARDAEDIAVVLKLHLEQDGHIRDVNIVEKLRYNTDPFYRAAADRALAAVREASPLKGLSPETYTQWAEMTMTFDPKEMFN